ncbi:MAG: leucine-rich repeat protein [Oscillibacter sp.]|nr:leucine-rich repeat protein [Oscillibacter sp.]
MKRRILAALLVSALVFSLLPTAVLADTITYGKFEFDTNTGTITKYLGTATTVTIPDKIADVTVTALGEGLFKDNTQLKTVVLPDTITSIAPSAFYKCTNLTNINIPDGVTSIGDHAFYGCTHLNNVTIPTTVKEIGSSAFHGNTALTSITILGTIKNIEERTFEGCSKLSTITLQEGVEKIGKRAFAETGVTQVTIPSSVKEIGEGAFQMSALTSLYIPDGVETIGNDAFSMSNNLTLVILPATLTSVGLNAFLSNSLDSVHFDGSESEIKPNVRAGLQNIDIHCQPSISRKIIGEAKCTTEGSTTITIQCPKCHKTFDQIKEILPKLPHNEVDMADRSPTCTQDGSRGGKQCKECQTITEAPEVIPATGHTWVVNKEEITKKPTCQETGVKKIEKECSVCHTTDKTEETIPLIAHTYTGGLLSEKETKPASCEEAGSAIKIKVCDVCKEPEDVDESNYYLYEQVEIPALGHIYAGGKTERFDKKKPTCSEAGYYILVKICDVCNKKDDDTDSLEYYHYEIPMLPHTPDLENPPKEDEIPEDIKKDIKEPTCTEGGTVARRCSVCGQIYLEAGLPATGHAWYEDVIKEATCTETGLSIIRCENCDETKDEKVIPATGHHSDFSDIEPTRVQEATCTDSGLEIYEGLICEECGKEYTAEVVIPPKGHTPSEEMTEDKSQYVAPTCTEPGKQVLTGVCAVCKEHLDAVEFPIAATGHTFGEWKDTSGGGKERTCETCGYTERLNSNGELIDPDNPPDEPAEPPVDPNATYRVNTSTISNGSVIRSVTSAKAGDTVTLTVYANAGYELSNLYVRAPGGNNISLTPTDTTHYTFTMPASRVTVYASFANAYPTVPTNSGGTSSSSSGSNSSSNSSSSANRVVPQASATGTIFYDIQSNHWASGEINWAYQNGFLSGVGGGRFNPDGTFTYQQMWMVLARLTGNRPANMAEAKQWALRNGFAEGANPNIPVPRQQLVVALYRCAALMGRTTTSNGSLTGYADSKLVANSARNAMTWAIGNGIISGTSDGRLNPAGTSTRAQFAVILYRYYRQIM